MEVEVEQAIRVEWVTYEYDNINIYYKSIIQGVRILVLVNPTTDQPKDHKIILPGIIGKSWQWHPAIITIIVLQILM